MYCEGKSFFSSKRGNEAEKMAFLCWGKKKIGWNVMLFTNLFSPLSNDCRQLIKIYLEQILSMTFQKRAKICCKKFCETVILRQKALPRRTFFINISRCYQLFFNVGHSKSKKMQGDQVKISKKYQIVPKKCQTKRW